MFICARLEIKLFVFVFRKQTTLAPFWKGDAMRNVLPEMLTELFVRSYFQQNELFIYFSHFCDIKSQFSYQICSYMRRLAIQNSLKCTGSLQIFIYPHWYFIPDTGLILRSIELFIYIQTCVNVNAYPIKKQTLNYSSFPPLLQSDLRLGK